MNFIDPIGEVQHKTSCKLNGNCILKMLNGTDKTLQSDMVLAQTNKITNK